MVNVPQGFKRVEADIFRFENIGDSIQGILRSVETGGKYENKVYKIETKDGIKAVFGSSVLEQLMNVVPINKEVIIVFTETKKSKNSNDTKIFEVFVK